MMQRSFQYFHSNNDDDDEEQFHSVSSSETERDTRNLQCRVCGDGARGYNFDQISCESCKAFFRRNALRSMPELRCRFGGKCEITVQSRRQCTYCRLKKCFDVQMRKEWIRSEEQRRTRKLKRLSKQRKIVEKSSTILINQNQKKSIDRFSTLSNQSMESKEILNYSSLNLTLDDWSLINNLSNLYDIWALDSDTNEKHSSFIITTSLTDFLNGEEKIYQNLITFFKQIPQFKQINIEDQILLIKCNITHLVHIHHVLKDHFEENPIIAFHMSRWINPQFHYQMSKTRHSMDLFIEHPIVLKLSLVSLMFVINLSRLPYEQLSLQLIQRDLLIKNQNFFISLLWKYLNVIYNEKNAIKAIQCIIFQYLQYQLLMNDMENFIMKEYHPNQFHPLTKSVLRLN